MHKFLFVGGSGHSGTTLLTVMLGFHSRIYSFRDETYVFRSDLSDDRIRETLATISAQRDKADVDYVCEKSPSHIRKCHEIFRLYPDAKFVAIKREPRDVIASFKRRGVTVDRGLHNWLYAYRRLLRWEMEKLPLHSVRFEDLIRDPAGTLSGICAYLGLAYEPAMLDYWKDRRPWQGVEEIRKPETVTGTNHVIYRNWQVHQPLMSDRIGTYRSDLSDDELRLIDSQVSKVAERLGYAPEATSGGSGLAEL
ncbi:MAG: sulfotransferase [Bradyrhizobium sp.]|nr:sulfotransferase [Bradyrhizobium sp.]